MLGNIKSSPIFIKYFETLSQFSMISIISIFFALSTIASDFSRRVYEILNVYIPKVLDTRLKFLTYIYTCVILNTFLSCLSLTNHFRRCETIWRYIVCCIQIGVLPKRFILCYNGQLVRHLRCNHVIM